MSWRRRAPWLLLALAASPGTSLAQEASALSQIWINPGFYSYHFDRDKNLEDANPGLGIEWPINAQWSFTAGAFRNSDRERSNYIGAYFMPFEWQGVKFGAALGVFDGYPNYRGGDWFPAVIPTAAIEWRHWGLNIGFIPPYKDRLHGAISFQLKARFGAPAPSADQ
ncbi:hypothetical protein ACIPRI_09395 [Variovorax sp. LARHSF232]